MELMTLVICLCGGTVGGRAAFAAGALAASIYSLGSPYGVPLPLMQSPGTWGKGVPQPVHGMLMYLTVSLPQSSLHDPAEV